MKCKFLYNKLTALGNLEGVPEMIAAEVSEVDLKIKEIEQMLFFKRSQQMRKLRKKVSNFLDQINFEIQAEDMEKIED
jgi:cell division protein ZapA (FtsZ GTPase activity inhibitor)